MNMQTTITPADPATLGPVHDSVGVALAPSALLPASPSVRERGYYLVGEQERGAVRPQPQTVNRTMINVNGRWSALRGTEVTFEQLVKIAFPVIKRGNRLLSVAFRRGAPDRPVGLLTPGDVISLTQGMIVNATMTTLS